MPIEELNLIREAMKGMEFTEIEEFAEEPSDIDSDI